MLIPLLSHSHSKSSLSERYSLRQKVEKDSFIEKLKTDCCPLDFLGKIYESWFLF
jgi:hypothetical protein